MLTNEQKKIAMEHPEMKLVELAKLAECSQKDLLKYRSFLRDRVNSSTMNETFKPGEAYSWWFKLMNPMTNRKEKSFLQICKELEHG